MIFREGDFECVKKLKKPADKVIKMRDTINYEMSEKRKELWNKIKENYERYLEGECGEFLPEIDRHIRSQFELALLILALSFKENNEDFKPARMFSDKDLEAYKTIMSYDVFEILSVDDIKKRIASKDEEVLKLLEKYYIYMKKWCEDIVNDPSINLLIRDYINKKCKEYREKINEAINSLIAEIDWFAKLVAQWKREAENLANKKVEEFSSEIRAMTEAEITEVIEKKVKEVEELVKKFEEKDREVKAKENELKVKEKEIERAIEEIRNLKEKTKGSRFVEVGKAKQYEMNFIGRIERKLGRELTLFGRQFRVEEVKEGKEVDTSKYIGMRSKWGVLTEKDVKNLPENRYITARFVEKKLFGSKKCFILKAIFTSRVDRFAEYGFDVDPLKLTEVNAYLVEARDKAKEIGETFVLCLASPTGFEDDVVKHINGEEFHKNFLSKYLSVCLVDLETGNLIYNPHDTVAKEFAKICEIEIDREKKERVRKCVEKMIDGHEWITLKDVLSCGDEAIVRAVFYEIAEEEGWKVRYIEGVGLVLMKN